MSPCEVGILQLRGLFEPESLLHEAFEQIGVVAGTDIILEWLAVGSDLQIAVEAVRQVECEDELSVLVDFRLDDVLSGLVVEGRHLLDGNSVDLLRLSGSLSLHGNQLLLVDYFIGSFRLFA